MRELILGGQKSGKSRAAEARASDWLAGGGREARLIATALPGDAEMIARIARHREDRRARLPALETLEVDGDLAGAIARDSTPARLLVIDCLTLWLTQQLLPLSGTPVTEPALQSRIDGLAAASRDARGPLVFVSNEIGHGVSPLSAEARHFVDTLGLLHQAIAATCERVTLMIAGCELPVRGPRHA